ncbi:MAG: SMP-30/gluconolactonase/LRE family protein [Candidatus Sabulitectum sp.]|nr:SMP-30/gluconolactonase/LRE family protein [Candidatus Sabulitectum sp.]
MKFLYPVLLAVIIMGCGEASSVNELYQEEAIPIDTLIPVDSIGILMGDSCYTLGAIQDYTMFPGSQPAILDRVKGTVSVFDSAGTFVNSFGGFGEGPGEFQHPFALTRLSSGIVIIPELMGKVTIFNSEGEYLSSWSIEGMGGLPLSIIPFDDSTFVCYYFTMKMGDEGFGIDYSLNRYDAITGDVVTEYFNWSGNPHPSTDFTPAYLITASDGHGKMYLSRIQSDSWMVEVYGENPEPLGTINLFSSAERIAVPDTAMVPGVMSVMYSFSDGESSTERAFVNMPEYHPFISALGVDGDGNIWCRRGGLPGDRWDVVSPEGENLREVVAALPDSAYYIDMDVSPHGILAFNMMTEDFHKLYIMGE